MTEYTKQELANQVSYLRFLLAQAFRQLPEGSRERAECFLGYISSPASSVTLDDVHRLDRAGQIGPRSFLLEAEKVGLIPKSLTK